MAKPIFPCIWYDGQAKEAADFYCSIFSHARIVAENPPVVIFEISGKKIMGLNGGPMFKPNPSISFFIYCPTVAETSRVWDRLMEGGKALIPIGEYPWSKHYGWAQDKFGMTWQVMLNEENAPGQSLTPSLLFTGDQFGRAEEAIKFYTSLFDNSRADVVVPYPQGDANAGKVMFSEFYLNGHLFIAMDGPGVHDYTFGEGVSLVVECDTQEEIDHYWDAFTKAGEESMCGWCKDQFGLSWQVVPSMLGTLMSDPAKRQQVMEALLKMKKIDIQALRDAG
ncbi:MAG: VOC family protein [Lewinellaceae bacterium]|nr:VOC family protein [Lewinellaceae bacterium]